MANRNFPSNKLYNSHIMPCLIDMQIAIGSSGAPTLSSAPYVQSVTRLAAGIYQIQLMDNYASLLGMHYSISSPVTGSAADPHGHSVGDLIQITTVGNTNWALAGVPASVTPAVGVTFVLAADPGVGTGRVKSVGTSGTSRIELASGLENSNSPSPGNGSIILVQCLQGQVPSATTQGTPLQYAAADPASGSILEIALYLNNSSVQ